MMASNRSQQELERPSFAKVAAMRLPPTQQTHSAQIETGPDSRTPMRIDEASNDSKSAAHESPQNLNQKSHDTIENLNRSVQDFHINMQKGHEVNSDTGDSRDDGVAKPEGAFEDDQTHLSNSSTKPTSFDSKSMASVTTFAMDEKESLRPDDSASVQAAEEDDSFSGPASGAPSSQVGSEAGGRLYRTTDQGTLSERIPNRPRVNNSCLPGIVSPNGQSELSLHSFPDEPDEKLLEAMSSPKDRLLILQLEEKIIAFIKDSSEQSLELPPCNAFGRLLAHKLGDYYHLTHFVDNNVTSVRLHRTPWCRVPTPLSMLQPPNANKTPPPNAPAMKIMRRSGQPGERVSGAGSTAPSSSAPSKATSEAGADGTNEEGFGSSAGATPAKDRATLSREEREAKYQEARERIFRDFPESKTSDHSNSGDQSANMSRSNSGNGKRKGHKQRTPRDDSFEARSQFNAYYPGAPYSSAPLPYSGMMAEGSFGTPAHYYVSTSSPPPANFPHGNHVNAVYQAQGNLTSAPPQYPVAIPPRMNQPNWQPGHLQQSPPYSGFSPVNQIPPMVPQQPSTRSSPGMSSYPSHPNTVPFQQQSSSNWNQPQYPTAYSPSPTQRNPSNTHWPNYPQHSMNPSQATYPYGQIPNQPPFAPSHQNNSGQHPLPGSFSRPPFNPQTRSFVPGSSPQTRFLGNPPQQPGINPAGVHSPQYPTPTPWAVANQDPSNHHHSNQPNPQTNAKILGPTSSMNHSTPGHHGPSPMMTRDSIAKWGTPAHLPPKPPPSQVPYDYDLKNKTAPAISPPQSFPSTPPAPLPKQSGPLVVSGGMGHQRSRGNMAAGL
ncbi:R3H domain-containing protein, variant [Blastomyces dermatitidis ATCC 18188]|uniref:R3H domain-containing protein n=1 Tax=Ajellomyces dermatitidis (strain ATCC 18188 / CBS 674.68) TaxID=653446 RepID=F2T8X4_AJEDA|nr:R3H domain-containing protein [Blastomyces dermatitidis ATCC 18188]KMW67088.1 R3H domain-containing protein, variant [Blastomyces dermatitidis ATCC 18188]